VTSWGGSMPEELIGPAPTGWRYTYLGDLQKYKGIQGGPFGSQLHAEDYVPSGIPLIMPKNIGENRLLEAGHDFITEGDAERLSAHRVIMGDIVVGRKGDLSRRALIREAQQGWLCGTDCIRIRVDESAVSSRYLSYYMGLKVVAGWLHRHDSGSTMPSLNTRSLGRLPVLLAPRHYQTAVADVMSALDDKIAVNERIERTTDELSSALFANILARDPAPSYVRLGEIAHVNHRKATPVTGGHLLYIDISSVSIGRLEWPKRTSWECAPGRARRMVSSGDTIWSTVRPNRKSFALILDDDPELVASTGFAVLTPVKVGGAFLYESVKRDEFVQYLESVAEGSAYPAVRAERFEQAVVLMPSGDHLANFEEAALPLRERAHTAAVESRALAELRDALLPKLMSGQIRVRDAEKVVEDVT
jgi:type I restriction enzyme, S subunit